MTSRFAHSRAFVLALTLASVPATAGSGISGNLDALNGTFRLVDTSTGKVLQDCNRAQNFALSADRREILLTEPWADFSATYLVVHSSDGRVLTIIRDEKRVNERGDPVLWWFEIEDKDNFRFRQYDWPAGGVTNTQWQRCAK